MQAASRMALAQTFDTFDSNSLFICVLPLICNGLQVATNVSGCKETSLAWQQDTVALVHHAIELTVGRCNHGPPKESSLDLVAHLSLVQLHVCFDLKPHLKLLKPLR